MVSNNTNQLIKDIEHDAERIKSYLEGKTTFVVILNQDGSIPISKDGNSIIGKYM